MASKKSTHGTVTNRLRGQLDQAGDAKNENDEMHCG